MPERSPKQTNTSVSSTWTLSTPSTARKRLEIPLLTNPHVWRELCRYLSFEARFLKLIRVIPPEKNKPVTFFIPETTQTVLLYYSRRCFDRHPRNPLCSFHAWIQEIDTNTSITCLHYFFFEDGHAEIRTDDRDMIIQCFPDWKNGLDSLLTIITLSTYNLTHEIPMFLRRSMKSDS